MASKLRAPFTYFGGKSQIAVEVWSRFGYGSQSSRGNENATRERIWFSPHCLAQPEDQPNETDQQPQKQRRKQAA